MGSFLVVKLLTNLIVWYTFNYNTGCILPLLHWVCSEETLTYTSVSVIYFKKIRTETRIKRKRKNKKEKKEQEQEKRKNLGVYRNIYIVFSRNTRLEILNIFYEWHFYRER